MYTLGEKIIPRDIEEEIKQSYLSYAMSVIVGRALPDVRDGLKPVHRRILFSMQELGLDPGKPYKKSARIVGECFVKDTLVLTRRGLVPIQDIERGDEVYTERNVRRVTKLYEMPLQPLLELVLENGTRNVVTPSQQFRVLTPELTFAWKEACALTARDYVVVRASYPELTESPALQRIRPEDPERFDASLAYLLGFWLSDGWIEKKRGRVGFYSNTRTVIERIAATLRDRFALAAPLERKRYMLKTADGPQRRVGYQVRISRDAFAKFLAVNFGIVGWDAWTKRIPDVVFRAPRQALWAFVSGLMDGDGSVHPHRNTIHYGSTSEELINQLALLLQHNGVFSRRLCALPDITPSIVNGRVVVARRKFHYLEIRGSNALRLARFLTVVNPTKRARLARITRARFKKTGHDTIPGAGEKIFGELSAHHLGSGWYQGADGTKFRQGIAYPDGTKIRYSSDLRRLPLRKSQITEWGIAEKLRRISSPLSTFVDGVERDELYFFSVASVEPRAAEPTYDIQVEGDHQLVANGMVAHNCLGKFHPHGDASVYDALVRMVQDFSLRYPLIDGQGNFGCFTGDTKIRLVDGTVKSFHELSQLPPGARFYVFSVDGANRIVIGEGKNARATRRNAALVEVLLDNGEKIRCTRDHRFLLRDGTYKPAKDLTPEDSLMAGYFDLAPVREERSNDYLRVQQPDGSRTFVHWLADAWNLARGRYERRTGRIRHHKDFDRFNNSPDNIERLSFSEHNRKHAEYAKTLWKQDAFRARQRAGVRAYYSAHPEIVDERRRRFVEANRSGRYRTEASEQQRREALRTLYEREPERRHELAQNARRRWQDTAFRTKMSQVLKGLAKRPLDEPTKQRVAEAIAEKSKTMWANETERARILRALKLAMQRPEVRRAISENSKALWRDASYRAKYASNHHRAMAKALWARPETVEQHRRKIEKQWGQETFRSAHRRGVIAGNQRRIIADPGTMGRLARRAATVLRTRWRQPEYRRRVMRAKIIGYAAQLAERLGVHPLTPEAFDAHRRPDGTPRYEKAVRYFDDPQELLTLAAARNHRVIAVRAVTERADVYDITVGEHHNFLLDAGVFVHNSVDGDSPAAMRYTEARLAATAAELLGDLDKDTVDFAPNFDGSLREPKVLPARMPNLLVNGSSGIAVGMATNIPPHNLVEIVDAVCGLIDEPESELAGLMKHVRGPDFPTGAIICGRDGIKDAYATGRGSLRIRAKAQVEQLKGNRQALVITELPYQVNKATLLETIAKLVQEKTIEGISDLRDESDKDGMRVVIELKRDANDQVVLNQLYKHTQMETTFGVIMLVIVDGRPRVLGLKALLQNFIDYRKEVVIRRTKFELSKAQERAHILEGLKIALANLDAVIKTIRQSKSPQEAKEALVKKFELSERQAQAILEMQLQRLTALERDKIEAEYKELLKKIEYYQMLLKSERKVLELIKDELQELKERFGDERRTEILGEVKDFKVEDLIAEEDVVLTISHTGYIKRLPVSAYRKQRRGGVGVTAMETKEEDFVEHLFVASTHEALLFFTNQGRCYWLKVHEVPQASRYAKGTAIVNLLNLQKDERLSTFVAVKDFSPEKFLIMATKQGTIKKTKLDAYANPRKAGIIAITLEPGDELIEAKITDGTRGILLITRQGKAIRFPEEQAREVGRSARGVRGVRLNKKDEVVSMALVQPKAELLTVTTLGFAKRSPIEAYRLQSRGGKGIINIKVTGKNGEVVGAKTVTDQDEVMLISQEGMMVRCPVKDVRSTGRAAQGVRLISMKGKDRVASVAAVVPKEKEEVAPVEAAAVPPVSAAKPKQRAPAKKSSAKAKGQKQ